MIKPKERLPKILFVLPNLNAGGAERIVVNILRTLKVTRYRVYVIVFDKVGDLLELIPDSAEIINLDIKRTRYSFIKVLRVINKLQPNLIFSSTNRTNLLILFVSYFFRFRSQIVIREPNSPYEQHILKRLPRYYLFLIKLLYPRADLIVSQTNNMKIEINQYFRIPNEKIRVINNPVDYNSIENKINNTKDPFTKGFINIVASGRITEQKGFDFLINSFKKVIETNDKFKLFILGRVEDTLYKEKLLNIIEDNKLENHISFLGYRDNPYIYFKYADLFVLSSRWEGFPNLVLESLYLGTPVVVTDCIPEFSEIIINGKNGYIVPIDDENEMSSKIILYNKLEKQQWKTKNFDFNYFFDEILGRT